MKEVQLPAVRGGSSSLRALLWPPGFWADRWEGACPAERLLLPLFVTGSEDAFSLRPLPAPSWHCWGLGGPESLLVCISPPEAVKKIKDSYFDHSSKA